MKLKILFIGLVFMCMSMFSQKKAHVVQLTKFPKIDSLNFNVENVLDHRLVKSNIGYAQKGAFNKKVTAVFPDSLDTYLKPIIKEMIIPKPGNKNIIIAISDLVVYEVTKATSETGYCRIQMEFLEKTDNGFLSYASAFADVENKGLDVTVGHSKRIIKALVECFNQFNELDFSKLEPEEYLINNTKPYNYKVVPKKGIYSTFFKMTKNLPDTLINYTLKKKGSKRLEKYYLYNSEDKIIRRRKMALSDGENIFIHASNYSYDSHYVKSKHVGKYIYFEDRYSDPIMAASFGLIGMLASNIKHGIILDTETGLVKILNEKVIKELLKNNYELYKKYQNSNKNLMMKELVILELNKLDRQ